MTKGESLKPEDAALEKSFTEDSTATQSVTATENEGKEDFLSNIDL